MTLSKQYNNTLDSYNHEDSDLLIDTINHLSYLIPLAALILYAIGHQITL